MKHSRTSSGISLLGILSREDARQELEIPPEPQRVENQPGDPIILPPSSVATEKAMTIIKTAPRAIIDIVNVLRAWPEDTRNISMNLDEITKKLCPALLEAGMGDFNRTKDQSKGQYSSYESNLN